MVKFERFVQVWRLWAGLPGLTHRVHELVLELLREAPNLRQAGKSIAKELQELGCGLESIRLDLERFRFATAYPVTVSILARIGNGTEKVRAQADWEGGPPEGFLVEREKVIDMIGSKTVFLAPGEKSAVEFSPQRMIHAQALIWVSGPGLIERVVIGHETIGSYLDGFGVSAVLPRAVCLGEVIECQVMGIGPRAFPTGRGNG